MRIAERPAPTAATLICALEHQRRCTLQLGGMVAGEAWNLAPRIWHWSSIGWQFGHVATFEQAFVLERLKGDGPLDEACKARFMPATAVPAERVTTPGRDYLLAYMAEVRRRVVDYVLAVPLTDELEFVLGMLVEHESMHLEHLLHMAYWLEPGLVRPVAGPMALQPPPGPKSAQAGSRSAQNGPSGMGPAEMVPVPAGTAWIGNSDPTLPWDNEHPAHEVPVNAFELASRPVTNGEYLAFVEAGGYHRRRWWSDAGWGSIELTGALHPFYWRPDGDGWRLRRLLGEVDLPPDEPVMGLSWFEAEAFAAWSGKRLPTEFEWEYAARLAGGPDGRTNCDFVHDGPSPSLPPTSSPPGMPQLQDLAGNVWEWTSSWFKPYAGFDPGIYERYSAPGLGEVYRVLRGGCWATISALCRPTFRNWYNPHLRQIFAGVRLAGPSRRSGPAGVSR